MMILQKGSKFALLHFMEKGINSARFNGQCKISMCETPTTSLSKAYYYRLWIVYLNTRYNISHPFRYLSYFKMTVVWCIWRTLFLKEVYLSFCLKKVTFFEKKMFFFLPCNTHFTSIFSLIAHYFNPRLQTMYWNVSIFNVSKRVELYHICFSKMGT